MIEKLILNAQTQPCNCLILPTQDQYSLNGHIYKESFQTVVHYLNMLKSSSQNNCYQLYSVVGSLLLSVVSSLFLLGWEAYTLKPVDTASSNYHTSRKLTTHITNALKGNTHFDITEFNDHYNTVRMETNRNKDIETQRTFDDIVSELNSTQEQAFRRARKTKISSWLSVISVAKHHFDLSA